MPLKELLEALAAQRAALRRKITPDAVHAFAKTVDDLGYLGPRDLEKVQVDFQELVQRVHDYYQRLLKRNPKDAVALNNMGVFLSNNGDPRRARSYFVRAVALMPDDMTIHENLRVADILTKKPEGKWHDYPEGLKPGSHTLAVYFDPHGM